MFSAKAGEIAGNDPRSSLSLHAVERQADGQRATRSETVLIALHDRCRELER
jgi:hypothetical protein